MTVDVQAAITASNKTNAPIVFIAAKHTTLAEFAEEKKVPLLSLRLAYARP